MRTPCIASAALLTGVLLAGAARAQPASDDQPDPVSHPERDVVEYRTDRLQILATHYYFPGVHDPRWLLLDVAIAVRSGGPLTVTPGDFSIVRPDGVELPLASQREYRESRAELLPMLLVLHERRDVIRDHFPGRICSQRNMRFFVDSGIRQTVADANSVGPCLRGDLFFAEPTGAWDSGAYTLVVGGDVDARLPIEIH